jgi:hypothetical protein
MKTTIKNCRLAIAFVYLLGMSQITHAQWSRTAPSVYLTTSTDKVGIGTTSPEVKFQINDQTPVSSFTGVNNAGLRIHSFDNPLNNYALLGFSGFGSYLNRNLAQIGANFTNNGSSLYFGTSNRYTSGITNIAMTIDWFGNVGIGTITPTQKLDVNGDAVFNGVRVGRGNSVDISNTIIGNGALNSNTTGSQNTANGYQALYTNYSGNHNTASGYQALYYNNALSNPFNGSDNTATGHSALYSNTSGYRNTANGVNALYFNTEGNNNTATGSQALYFNTYGIDNVATGIVSLYSNTGGSFNTALGNGALFHNTTGSLNTAIGQSADVGAGNLSNATAIGANAIVQANNRMQLGSSTTLLATSGGYTIVSDGRFKDEVKTDDAPGLAFINKLRPVAYNFNYKRYDDFLKKDIKANKESKATQESKIKKAIDDEYQQQLVEKSKQRQVGFIAQEVDQLCRDNKFTFNGVYAPQNNNDNYALDYSRFVVPLVKAVQELSSENKKLKEEINQLKATVYESDKMNNGMAGISVKAASDVPLLGQNIPNPAANNTIIPFRIPKNCNSASIVISELGSGKIVTAIPVSCIENHLAIDAGTLASGKLYLFTVYKWKISGFKTNDTGKIIK